MVGDVIRVFIQAQRIHYGLSYFARGAFAKHGQYDACAIGRNGKVTMARLQSFEQSESELGAGECGDLAGGGALEQVGLRRFAEPRKKGRHREIAVDYTLKG